MSEQNGSGSWVEGYLAHTRKEVENLRRREKEALLRSVGLVSGDREYAEYGYRSAKEAREDGYNYYEVVNGEPKYYAIKNPEYPDVTDEQLEEIKKLAAERNRLAQKLDDSVQDDRGSKNSFAARFLRGIAILTWFGGFIAAIALSVLPVQNSRGSSTEFNFGLFIGYLAAFFISGALVWCMSELFVRLRDISSDLEEIKNR